MPEVGVNRAAHTARHSIQKKDCEVRGRGIPPLTGNTGPHRKPWPFGYEAGSEPFEHVR